MKIGILTFFRNNYGAILQAYALQTILESWGHSVEIIDYEAKPRHSALLFKSPGSVKNFVLKLFKVFRYQLFTKREQRFAEFQNQNLRVSKKKYHSSSALKESLSDYNAFICGSDQVWHPKQDHDRNRANYLGFFQQKDAVKISYAPSFGVSSVSQSFQEEIRPWINDITNLSIREQTGSTIIERATGRKAAIVLDPTLLLEDTQWASLERPLNIKPPYILVYSTSQRGSFSKLVKHLKKKTHLPVAVLSLTSLNLISEADWVIYDAGPIEFISLFANATCICTNSFHGTAFSIIYRKPFWGVPHNTTNSRIADLLSRVDLSARQLTVPDQFPASPLEINFTVPVSLLNREKQRSFDFLKSALQHS